MDRQFWLERWEQRQIGFHQADVNRYLTAHWSSLGVPPGGTVFVPLCGKSRDMWWLHEQGHPVLGIELSRAAVQEFFAGQQLDPRVTATGPFEAFEAPGYRLLCGDFFELTAVDLQGVRAVFDRAALIALPPAMRPRYVAHLAAILPPQAPTLLVTISYPQQQTPGPPFSVPEDEVRQLYSARRVEKLQDQDVLALAENARFRERGVARMSEQAYRIS
jgi:thiopurine S-methyltransferase